MVSKYFKREYGADKIALLIFFALSMVMAQMIVKTRSKVELSDPITLEGTSLAIALPNGKKWQSAKKWQHINNNFVLTSILRSDPKLPSPQLHCTYLIDAENISEKERIDWKAKKLAGNVQRSKTIKVGNLNFETAQIQITQTPVDLLYANANLPDGRVLEIEFYYLIQSGNIISNAFDKTLQSVTYENQTLLSAGADIVKKIKAKGIDKILSGEKKQSLYIVLENDKPIGFSMDTLNYSKIESVTLEIFTYLRTPQTKEIAGNFKGKPDLSQFEAVSEIRIKNSAEKTRVIGNNSLLTVENLYTASKKILFSSQAAIPDGFDQIFIKHFLKSDHDKAMIDVIDYRGEITPVIYSKEEKPNRVIISFPADYMPQRYIYLDKLRRIEKIEVEGEKKVLIPVEAKDIIRLFPERAEFVLKKAGLTNKKDVL